MGEERQGKKGGGSDGAETPPPKGNHPIPDSGITAVHGDGGEPRTPGAGDPRVTQDPEDASGGPDKA